jgi:hypothetical protein
LKKREHRQASKWADRKIGRQADGQTGRQADGQTGRWENGKIAKQSNVLKEGWEYRQMVVHGDTQHSIKSITTFSTITYSFTAPSII